MNDITAVKTNMFENDARLRELSGKAIEGSMTDEEFGELAQLSKAKQKLREGRVAMIASVRETLQNQRITIKELFSDIEIAAALAGRNSIGSRATWARRKTGLVLVEVKASHGNPCRYCQGQALPFYVSKGFKLLDDGQLEAHLERCYTEEGRQYFATAEGRDELAQLIKYIRTHIIKPNLASGRK